MQLAYLDAEQRSKCNLMAPTAIKSKFWTPEFVLVWTMLLVLLVLVIIILFIPLNSRGASDVNFAAVAEYRKTILSIIITAFGAWVGAGAAYFFGKDNLRVATESILAMREPSPQERLRRTPIRAIPPKPLDWVVAVSVKLGTVIAKLKAEPQRWFVPIVAADGSLQTVLHEQAIWRFVYDRVSDGATTGEVSEKTISDVIDYVKKTPGLEKDINIYVAVTEEQTAGEAYDLMQANKVFIAVVIDRNKEPKYYFDTADIRNLLFQSGASSM